MATRLPQSASVELFLLSCACKCMAPRYRAMETTQQNDIIFLVNWSLVNVSDNCMTKYVDSVMNLTRPQEEYVRMSVTKTLI